MVRNGEKINLTAKFAKLIGHTVWMPVNADTIHV